MDDKPDRRAKIEQIRNFQGVVQAGSGATRFPDVRGQAFDASLKNGEFHQSGLHEVATAYMENVRRLRTHAMMPVTCIDYGRVFQNVFLQVCHEHGVPPATIDNAFGVPSDLDAYVKVGKSLLEWIFGEAQRSIHHGTPPISFYTEGFAMLDHGEFKSREIQTQITSLCGSLTIEAWTLFEGLCEDLWEAALNFHPDGLAALKGKLRSKSTSSGPTAPTGSESTIKLSFDDLQTSRFEIRNKLGTIQKASVSFRSLLGIREAYQRAFFAQHQSIDDILNDEGLEYAAAVRRDIVESCVWVKKGKRRRILLFSKNQQPHTGPERYATHATDYDERVWESSGWFFGQRAIRDRILDGR